MLYRISRGGIQDETAEQTKKDIKEGYYNYYSNELFKEPNPYNPFMMMPKPYMGYGRGIEGARGCVRACMIHLEKQGKLQNKFKKKFRRRPAWKLEPLEGGFKHSDEATDQGGSLSPYTSRSSSEE